MHDFACFEEASRGPLGALQFLRKIHRRAGVASIGCIIIVATLAMEPFTQQILSFPVQLVPRNSSSATLQVTQMYHHTSGHQTDDTMNALWASFLQVQRGYSCNSDKCSWTNFTSLEICNECKDVSKQLVIDCVPTPHSKRCKYTFPSSPGVPMLHSTRYFIDNMGSTMFNATARTKYPKAGQSADLANVFLLDTSNKELLDPRALECTLRWCAKSYAHLHVVNGTLEEEGAVIRDLRFSDVIWSEKYAQLRGFYPAFVSSTYSAEKVPHGDLSELDRSFSDMPRNPDVFFVHYNTIGQLDVGMDVAFGGGVDRTGSVSVTEIVASGIVQSFGDQIALQMYKSAAGNYSKMMDNFAAALTNQIKIPNGQALEGVIQKAEPFVQVSWPWILLPALIVVCSAMFLPATMMLSAEASRVVWKTSALSGLFHGLHGWQTDMFGGSWTKGHMDEVAKTMWAQLQYDERGKLLLKQSEPSSKGGSAVDTPRDCG